MKSTLRVSSGLEQGLRVHFLMTAGCRIKPVNDADEMTQMNIGTRSRPT
jgi:hypothetical protein